MRTQNQPKNLQGQLNTHLIQRLLNNTSDDSKVSGSASLEVLHQVYSLSFSGQQNQVPGVLQ